MNLGVVGTSSGNGHPYSWSAILNGYDPAWMEQCPYPTIPGYLRRHRHELGGLGATVSHVWCHEEDEARSIAAAALIPRVCESIDELISNVDAVLHARDDYEQHSAYVAKYLAAGKPVFVDKPIANSVAAAAQILSMDPQEGLLFTCTGLRFDPRIADLAKRSTGLGDEVVAIGPKDWSRYAIHLIEPGLLIAKPAGPLLDWGVEKAGDARRAKFRWSNGSLLAIETTGRHDTPFSFSINGQTIWLSDPFDAFRSALGSFIRFVESGRLPFPRSETLQVVDLIERGA